MGFYQERILPRLIDRMLGAEAMRPIRGRAMEGISGEVVELGFGSGPNIGLYPDAVTKVLAVEPSGLAQRLAQPRLERSVIPVELIGLDGESIPLDDSSVDNVLSTWTLCTIPNLAAALAEVKRVLRPGGSLYYLEHGLSDNERVARRQQRWNGVQRRIAGGCNLNRRIDEIVADAGFTLDRDATFTIAGPRTMSFMYAGVATPISD